MSELLPCPFCGCAGAVVQPEDARECLWEVVCASTSGCGAASGWNLTKDKAIAAWNRRTPAAQDAAQGLTLRTDWPGNLLCMSPVPVTAIWIPDGHKLDLLQLDCGIVKFIPNADLNAPTAAQGREITVDLPWPDDTVPDTTPTTHSGEIGRKSVGDVAAAVPEDTRDVDELISLCNAEVLPALKAGRMNVSLSTDLEILLRRLSQKTGEAT